MSIEINTIETGCHNAVANALRAAADYIQEAPHEQRVSIVLKIHFKSMEAVKK